VAAGSLTAYQLRRIYQPVYPGVYVPRGAVLSARQRSRAAWLWSRRRGVPAGLSASALLGAKWIDGDHPAELLHANRRPPSGLIIHSDALAPGDVCRVGDMQVTTAARTAFDLGRRLGLTEAVQRIDALMNVTDLKAVEVEAVMSAHRAARGLVRLRRALRLADAGAESPYETLTRLTLVRAGFPAPQTQVPVCDGYGRVIARLDMGWREWQVGVDFDGAQHWTDVRQRSWDIERYTLLPELGWIDIRVNSALLHRKPREFLDRVGAALRARGCPKTW
jgi:very-short-patch-repair endonuclease